MILVILLSSLNNRTMSMLKPYPDPVPLNSFKSLHFLKKISILFSPPSHFNLKTPLLTRDNVTNQTFHSFAYFLVFTAAGCPKRDFYKPQPLKNGNRLLYCTQNKKKQKKTFVLQIDRNLVREFCRFALL